MVALVRRALSASNASLTTLFWTITTTLLLLLQLYQTNINIKEILFIRRRSFYVVCNFVVSIYTWTSLNVQCLIEMKKNIKVSSGSKKFLKFTCMMMIFKTYFCSQKFSRIKSLGKYQSVKEFENKLFEIKCNCPQPEFIAFIYFVKSLFTLNIKTLRGN